MYGHLHPKPFAMHITSNFSSNKVTNARMFLHVTVSPSTSQPSTQQASASQLNTSQAANKGKCNWCLEHTALIPGKKFCADCNSRGSECAYCHRPMPARFFAYSSRLCNACFKKDRKQKEKRRKKTVFYKGMY